MGRKRPVIPETMADIALGMIKEAAIGGRNSAYQFGGKEIYYKPEKHIFVIRKKGRSGHVNKIADAYKRCAGKVGSAYCDCLTEQGIGDKKPKQMTCGRVDAKLRERLTSQWSNDAVKAKITEYLRNRGALGAAQTTL